MAKHQHVTRKSDGSWNVLGEGNKRATSNHPTQKAAEEAARVIARNNKTDVITHGMDGKIRSRDSYGNDPYPPKG